MSMHSHNENKCDSVRTFFSHRSCTACHLWGFSWMQTHLGIKLSYTEVNENWLIRWKAIISWLHKQRKCWILTSVYRLWMITAALSQKTSHKHTGRDNEGRLKVATSIYPARGSWQDWLYTYQVVRMTCRYSSPQCGCSGLHALQHILYGVPQNQNRKRRRRNGLDHHNKRELK